MAVVGFSGGVYVSNASDHHLIPHFFIAGALGIIAFVFCSAALNRKLKAYSNPVGYKKRIVRSSISWLILIALAVLFILIVLLVTR